MKLFNNLNWLAVIISVVACMALGFIWYGFLFNQTWMDGNGITIVDQTKGIMAKNGVEHTATLTPMIINALFIVLFSIIMNWLINKTNDNTLIGGLTIGFVIGLIGALGVLTGNMFAMNPFSLTICDGLYTLIMFCIIGAVMGGIRKKATV